MRPPKRPSARKLLHEVALFLVLALGLAWAGLHLRLVVSAAAADPVLGALVDLAGRGFVAWAVVTFAIATTMVVLWLLYPQVEDQ